MSDDTTAITGKERPMWSCLRCSTLNTNPIWCQACIFEHPLFPCFAIHVEVMKRFYQGFSHRFIEYLLQKNKEPAFRATQRHPEVMT